MDVLGVATVDVSAATLSGTASGALGSLLCDLGNLHCPSRPVWPRGSGTGVIGKLARFERMDLLIHFPTTGIKRNFWQGAKEKLDGLIGRPGESGRVSNVAQRIEELRAELATLGYTGAAVRSIPVKHAGRLLYHVMFASKNERGDAIWDSISKTLSSGQRRLFQRDPPRREMTTPCPSLTQRDASRANHDSRDVLSIPSRRFTSARALAS